MQSRRLSKRSVLGCELSPWESAWDMRPVFVDRGRAQREGGEEDVVEKEHGRPTCNGERDLRWPCKGACANHALETTTSQKVTSHFKMAAEEAMGKEFDLGGLSHAFENEAEMKQDYRRSICLLEEKRKVVSSNIEIPKARKCEDEFDMDKVTAAMVLTSLSTSPVVRSPPPHLTDINGSWKDVGFIPSSTSSSDYWSWGTPSDYSNPSTPSPPLCADSFKHFQSPTLQDNSVEDTETSSILLDEPIPRKRKNSMKVMFQCLWKKCGKVLSTVAGIKKHIRTIHLGRGGELDDNEGEEDFYYTEVRLNKDSSEIPSNLSPVSPVSSPPSTSHFADAPNDDTFSTKAENKMNTLLSNSSPATFYLLTSDHAYQVSSPLNIPGSKTLHLNVNNLSTFTRTTVSRVCCNSSEEHKQCVRTVISSPTRGMGMRKPRGENKKCRKVYGMENRDKWCTACRWKKACQRFLD
ncbi:zinc finger protein 704 [Pelodytes ibericus]